MLDFRFVTTYNFNLSIEEGAFCKFSTGINYDNGQCKGD